MPVVVRPSSNLARPYYCPIEYAPKTAQELFEKSCPKEHESCSRVIQSSFTGLPLAGDNHNVMPSKNGFVRAATSAYNQHHHLRIRPEDVWFAILTQLSFHINANAEQLRSYFVAHKGQKELKVYEVGTIDSVDHGMLAVRFTHLMHEQILDKDFRDWVMPDFTTTEPVDTVTAAVLMMGSMQKYFSFKSCCTCGIPSVTLLGEKKDWESIRKRLDELTKLGKEPTQFASLLTPVLDAFVRTFDDPTHPSVVEFWAKIAHQSPGGSGPVYLSGWITAFCFWDADGKLLNEEDSSGCKLGDVEYHTVDTDDIPEGFVSVPVTVDDNGTEHKTRMVAGSVGITVTDSGEEVQDPNPAADSSFDDWGCAGGGKRGGGGGVRDTVQPLSGWWMHELLEEGESNAAAARDSMAELDG